MTIYRIYLATFVKEINLFLDDSDTELKDFLPAETKKGMSRVQTDAEDSETGYTPPDSVGRRSGHLSRRDSEDSLDNEGEQRGRRRE